MNSKLLVTVVAGAVLVSVHPSYGCRPGTIITDITLGASPGAIRRPVSQRLRFLRFLRLLQTIRSILVSFPRRAMSPPVGQKVVPARPGQPKTGQRNLNLTKSRPPARATHRSR